MVEPCPSLDIPAGSHKNKVIGVLTSGADRYGMNAAVRASVLVANYIGSKVYIIHKGFRGLIKGGDNIVEADWKNVTDVIYHGGTVFGAGTTSGLKIYEARLEATYNLISKRITYLIIIGGTNSMVISDILKNEWAKCLDELVKTERITKKQTKNKDKLHIVYVPCSIDNLYGSDIIPIGRDSAAHRIIGVIDDLANAGHSNKQILILEIEGVRNGYLALLAALCCEADYLFIPEYPTKSDWPNRLCEQISIDRRKSYKHYNIIVITRGATDFNGESITAADVKNVIFQKLGKESSIIVLGAVQTGGFPSGFDRYLATRLGAEAVTHLVTTDNTVSSVITLQHNETIPIPLPDLMKHAMALSKAITNKNWELVLRLNGQTFENKLQRYLMKINIMRPIKQELIGPENYRLAIMCIGGPPVCGTNAAIEFFVRLSIYRGYTVLGIQNGINGLLKGSVKKMTWSDVSHLVSQNGAILGSRRTLPIDLYQQIAERFTEHNIQGLLIIGGFDAYHTSVLLCAQRAHYNAFRIPIVVVPATASNNVPGTVYTLGSDSALNQIITLFDKMSQAHAEGELISRVSILEIKGGYNGYLSTMAGITVGAEAAYIFEEEFKIADLRKDIDHIISKVSHGIVARYGIVHHERASEYYNSEFLRRLFTEESNGLYQVTVNTIGLLQQGGAPSPFDRNMGMKMAATSLDWLINKIKKNTNEMGVIQCNNPNTACVLGSTGRQYKFTSVVDLIDDTEKKNKKLVDGFTAALKNSWKS